MSRPVIVVAGDVTMDWNLADTSPRTTAASWSSEQHSAITFQPGGACLLANLIGTVVGADIRSIEGAENRPPRPDDHHYHHSTAVWARYPRTLGAKDARWRLHNYVGLARRDPRLPPTDKWTNIQDDSEQADVVVIDDAALTFRGGKHERWPAALKTPGQLPWVVLKTACPVGEGALTGYLLANLAERLIVVTTADDLRRSDIGLGAGLSWEAAAEDLAGEIASHPRLSQLSKAAAMVVSFGAAGAFVARQSPVGRGLTRGLVFTLVMDPEVIEGTWESQYPGGMIGGTTCLTAGVVSAIASRPEGPDVMMGVRRGLAGLRQLHRSGYVDRSDDLGTSIRFPFAAVASALEQEEAFSMAPVPSSVHQAGSGRPENSWSILRDRFLDDMNVVATAIVRRGPEQSLKDVPLGRFGHLLTADRREIEGFRSLGNLITEYCSIDRPSRPLSIAVFGPPGSGKSFAVKELARALPIGEVEVMTFNLSQFGEPGQLRDAFHRVRDAGLSARIPLVFWDEFDSSLGGERLGWIRHFLAPMQDGEFRQGQINHPIGRAIFVFAGSSVAHLDALGRDLTYSDHENPASWRAVKGPDFLSRLRGFTDISGPDPRSADPRTNDAQYVIRRAIILRSLLQRTCPQISRRMEDGTEELAIDDGVLRAFLDVRAYRHGIRSMEAIISMSRLTGEPSFHRSALPPAEQLHLHVDADEFLALATQEQLTGDLLERLAADFHESYRSERIKRSEPSFIAGCTYDNLSQEQQNANRAAVRDIPNKLASIGYTYRRAFDALPLAIPANQIEALAEREHDRWMTFKIRHGYCWGNPASDEEDLRTHPALVPWRPLTDSERRERYSFPVVSCLGPGSLENDEETRDQDRHAVRVIPELLAKEGLAVVPMH